MEGEEIRAGEKEGHKKLGLTAVGQMLELTYGTGDYRGPSQPRDTERNTSTDWEKQSSDAAVVPELDHYRI